jgi:hypothetical protein
MQGLAGWPSADLVRSAKAVVADDIVGREPAKAGVKSTAGGDGEDSHDFAWARRVAE